MSDEVAVLRAAGLETAAKLIEAARAGQVAAQPPTAPAAPAEPTPGQLYAAQQQVQVAAAPQGPPPPPGKAPLTSVEDWEALGQNDQLARMDELDVILREAS